MIAFVTIRSLVPLIEGLSSSDSISIRVMSFTIRSLLFRKEKYVEDKKQPELVRISYSLIAYIYTCVLCTHQRIHVCGDWVHLDSSGPSSVSSRPLGSHRAPHHGAQCVCVCVYAHIHPRTLPPPSKKMSSKFPRKTFPKIRPVRPGVLVALFCDLARPKQAPELSKARNRHYLTLQSVPVFESPGQTKTDLKVPHYFDMTL